jgi:hypothetical protein
MNNLQIEELFLPSFLYFSIDNCSIPSTEKLSGDAIQRLKPATSWRKGSSNQLKTNIFASLDAPLNLVGQY